MKNNGGHKAEWNETVTKMTGATALYCDASERTTLLRELHVQLGTILQTEESPILRRRNKPLRRSACPSPRDHPPSPRAVPPP